MARLYVTIPDELEKEFRKKVSQEGYKKGDMSKEIERLIRESIEVEEELKIFAEDE